MRRPSDSVQLEATAPLLRAALIVVLIVAVVAGIFMVGSSQIGWAALGFALVGGPVAVLVEGRSRRTRSSVTAISMPILTPTPPARTQLAPPPPEAHWQLAQVQEAVPAWSSTGIVERAPSYFFEDPGVATATRFTPLQAR
jgi:hypothetical protein